MNHPTVKLPEDDLELVRLLLALAVRIPSFDPRTMGRKQRLLAQKRSRATVEFRRKLVPACQRLRSLWNHYRHRNEREWTDDWIPSFIDVDTWAWSDDRKAYRQKAIDFLETLQERLRAGLHAQDPQDHPEQETGGTVSSVDTIGVVSPKLAPASETQEGDYWSEGDDGSVVVVCGGKTARITAPRRALMFKLVARAHGRTVRWSDVLEELARADGETFKMPDLDDEPRGSSTVTSIETVRRYGRKIREDIKPFGQLWHQDGFGAKWAGGPEAE